MKNHRQNVIKSACFCILFWLCFCIATYIVRPDNDTKQRFAGFYCQPEDTIDVLYVGASPVHPYWSAPLAWHDYGFTSWPLSSNGQMPGSANLLIREALNTQNPQIVVCELRMFTMQQKTFESNSKYEAYVRNVADNMKMSRNRISVINHFIDDKDIRYGYYFDMTKYHTRWKRIIKSDYGYWNFEKSDMNAGNFISDDVINFAEIHKEYNGISKKYPIPTEQEEELRKLLGFLKERNIIAVFTLNPYPDYSDKTKMMANYISDIIENEYGYIFLNLNDRLAEMKIDFSSDFYDGGHMNTYGAVKFTHYLADYLVKTYGLEDKRGGVLSILMIGMTCMNLGKLMLIERLLQ